jgi:hypothetical protein
MWLLSGVPLTPIHPSTRPHTPAPSPQECYAACTGASSGSMWSKAMVSRVSSLSHFTDVLPFLRGEVNEVVPLSGAAPTCLPPSNGIFSGGAIVATTRLMPPSHFHIFGFFFMVPGISVECWEKVYVARPAGRRRGPLCRADRGPNHVPGWWINYPRTHRRLGRSGRLSPLHTLLLSDGA